MNLGQALVLVLSFPVLGILLAALTILEQRVLGGPNPSPGDRASAGEPAQPPAAFPGHPGRDPEDARGPQPPAAHQPGMASPGQELPPVARPVPPASQARPPHPRSGQSGVPGHTAAARAAPPPRQAPPGFATPAARAASILRLRWPTRDTISGTRVPPQPPAGRYPDHAPARGAGSAARGDLATGPITAPGQDRRPARQRTWWPRRPGPGRPSAWTRRSRGSWPSRPAASAGAATGRHQPRGRRGCLPMPWNWGDLRGSGNYEGGENPALVGRRSEHRAGRGRGPGPPAPASST
jgi:hypothetical protein